MTVAGRELDALVAEKIMGWQDYMPPNTYAIRLLPLEMAATWGTGEGRQGIPLAKPEDPRDGARAAYVPYYSTDIAAAWQVMEKLRVDGYKDVVITTGTDDGLWSVGIHRREAEWHLAFGIDPRGRSMAPVAHDESLPLAICLAALKAVGVD